MLYTLKMFLSQQGMVYRTNFNFQIFFCFSCFTVYAMRKLQFFFDLNIVNYKELFSVKD